MAQQIIPGHEYQIAGSAVFERDGHTQNAVYFTTDGLAFAGRVRTDAKGAYFEMAFDADDERIEAADGWQDCIVGTVAPVSPPPAPAFPVRKHFGGDFYTYDEMQAMVNAANSRPVTLGGRPARFSWAGPKASAFDGWATTRSVTWPQLAQALNGAGAL